MLPAWLTVFFVLGLALFMDMGAGHGDAQDGPDAGLGRTR